MLPSVVTANKYIIYLNIRFKIGAGMFSNNIYRKIENIMMMDGSAHPAHFATPIQRVIPDSYWRT